MTVHRGNEVGRDSSSVALLGVGLAMLVLVTGVSAACAKAARSAAPPASASPSSGYPALDAERVPQTLDEALDTLERGLPAHALDELRASESDVVLPLQDTLGRWMRDRWGLWTDAPLARHLRELGLEHADDMSGVVLTSFWRRLHFQPLRVEAQVRWYQAFRHASEPPDPASNEACAGRVDITSWWTPRLDQPAAVDPRPARALRVVHVGPCCADGRLWAWEAGRGWFEPDAAHRRQWERLPVERRGCR